MSTKYESIKKEIIKNIVEGKFKPGEKIYTESQIKDLFSVSSITAVKALNELAKEGYIVRYQGKGSFVSRRKRETLVVYSDLEKIIEEEKVMVLDVKLVTSEECFQEIGIKNEFIRIRRLKIDGDIPYNFIESYIPKTIISNELSHLDHFSSVYNRILEDSGLNLLEMYFEQKVEVNQDIPEYIASYLKRTDSAIVAQTKKTFDDKKTLVEFTRSFKRSDYYAIMFKASK